ncbi:MAG TPA: VOC family protein [Candidatus Dormibacteraeota bacterium]
MSRDVRSSPWNLDHVLIAVADLAAAAREIEARHGLASIDGGRHSAWGTANRIVPVGDSYLEQFALAGILEGDEEPVAGVVYHIATPCPVFP